MLWLKSKVERKELLKKLIDVMPTMDVRSFVKVVNNIESSLGTSARGDFMDSVILGELTNHCYSCGEMSMNSCPQNE